MNTSALQSWFQAGGPVMYGLLACSLLAGTITFERLFSLRRGRVLDGRLQDAIRRWREGESIAAVQDRLRRSHSFLAYLLGPLFGGGGAERESALLLLQQRARRVEAQLGRGLHVLELVVGVAPLLGLLGTVLGMIEVFAALSRDAAVQGPLLSAGIAEALITTVAGLCVAIPTLIAYALFTRRVESLELELEAIGLELLARLTRAPGGSAPGAPVR